MKGSHWKSLASNRTNMRLCRAGHNVAALKQQSSSLKGHIPLIKNACCSSIIHFTNGHVSEYRPEEGHMSIQRVWMLSKLSIQSIRLQTLGAIQSNRIPVGLLVLSSTFMISGEEESPHFGVRRRSETHFWASYDGGSINRTKFKMTSHWPVIG